MRWEQWFNISFVISCITIKPLLWVLTLWRSILSQSARSYPALHVDSSCWEDKCFAQGKGMHWVTVELYTWKQAHWPLIPNPPLHSTTCGNTVSTRRATICNYLGRLGEWGKEKQGIEHKTARWFLYVTCLTDRRPQLGFRKCSLFFGLKKEKKNKLKTKPRRKRLQYHPHYVILRKKISKTTYGLNFSKILNVSKEKEHPR